MLLHRSCAEQGSMCPRTALQGKPLVLWRHKFCRVEDEWSSLQSYKAGIYACFDHWIVDPSCEDQDPRSMGSICIADHSCTTYAVNPFHRFLTRTSLKRSNNGGVETWVRSLETLPDFWALVQWYLWDAFHRIFFKESLIMLQSSAVFARLFCALGDLPIFLLPSIIETFDGQSSCNQWAMIPWSWKRE